MRKKSKFEGKEKLGGATSKSLSFGAGCADFAEFLSKSHLIAKHKKSMHMFGRKTLLVLRTIPPSWKIGLSKEFCVDIASLHQFSLKIFSTLVIMVINQLHSLVKEHEQVGAELAKAQSG